MDYSGISKKSRFRVPYVNGKYIVGLGFLVGLFLMIYLDAGFWKQWHGKTTVDIFLHGILDVFFWLVWLVMSIITYRMNFSLLPVAGILINLYLMSELGTSNWFIFLLWLIAGLTIYFMYGYKNSKLNRDATSA